VPFKKEEEKGYRVLALFLLGVFFLLLLISKDFFVLFREFSAYFGETIREISSMPSY